MKKLMLTLGFVCCTFAAQAKPYLDIQELETPKGLSVWFVQDKIVPVIALKFSLKQGAQLDPKGKEGSAELLSALFDEGAGKRDAEQFQNTLDAYGIKMGFSAARDGFYGSLKTTTENQSVAWELFDDALNKTHFSEEAVARMKSALQSNLRFQQMEPDYIAQKTLFEMLFKDQPYARPVEGTMESLAGLTPKDMQSEKDALFCRERLKIAVVGSLKKEQVMTMVDRFFATWPSCPKSVANEKQTINSAGKDIFIPWQGAQSVVMMAQPGLSRQDKDWWAARILDFALGGGQFSSRLMEEVRVKRGLTYGVSTSIAPLDEAPLWFVQAGVDPSKTKEAVDVIKQIWADVAANGLKDDEIQEAKDYLNGSLPLALTSTDAIAGILLQLQEDNLPKNTLDTRAAEINAVTPQDIKRVAKERLNAEHLTTIIVGPKQ